MAHGWCLLVLLVAIAATQAQNPLSPPGERPDPRNKEAERDKTRKSRWTHGNGEPGGEVIKFQEGCAMGPGPPEPSYFLLVSRTVRPGMDLNLTVMITKASSDVTIKAVIQSEVWRSGKYETELIANNSGTFSPGQKSILTVKIPQVISENLYSFTLNVTGSGGLSFTHEESVSIRRKFISIFIQTDKSQYKPGQIVRMRTFAVDSNLKPYHGGMDIKIKDRARNVIKYWKNEKGQRGVVQKELVLADQPVMGQWRIEVTAKGETTSKTFDIKEYVLPKVEVEVDVDQYQDVKAQYLNGTIRARYTYGKPVDGPVNITLSTEIRKKKKVPTATLR